MTTEMFEGPDGLLYANPAECADAWAHEATSIRAALAEAERDARRWREEGYACSNFVRRISKGQVYTATEATEYLSAIDAAMAREEG